MKKQQKPEYLLSPALSGSTQETESNKWANSDFDHLRSSKESEASGIDRSLINAEKMYNS